MPTDSFLPAQDAALAAWLANFLSVAADNMTTLHLTTTDLNTLDTQTSAFNTQTTAQHAARQAAKAATQTRAATRASVVADARALVKRIQALPGIPDDLKTQLGINVPSGRRPEVPVFQPTSPSATLQADLSVLVKWHKNGNAYGTAYVVERQNGAGAAWTTVKTQTATRFVDTTVAPGVNATYRITATRGHLASMPSAEASIYPNAASAKASKASAAPAPASVDTAPVRLTLKSA